eukprot:260226_1
MSSRFGTTFVRRSKYVHVNCKQNISVCTRTFSSLQELFDEDLETQLNVLAMDETMRQQSSSLTNEKLENIFSKIRQANKTEHDDEHTEPKILQFEDLFPLHSKPMTETQHEPPQDIPSASIEPEALTIDPNESVPETPRISIDMITEDDILSIPSTAVTKQLLSTKKNTVDNFGMHLYNLLQYNPSGVMEHDIASTYYKHFGCEYPFEYTSSMAKYIIGSCSHLFIIRSDVLGRKLILNRSDIASQKYLNLDTMSYLRQSQLLHYLLTHNDKKSVSPSTNIQIMSSYINSNTLNDELLKISELQDEFFKHFHGLFLCSNLYKLVNRLGAIKKIASGVGDMTDFYLMWHYAEEDLAGMNIIFKIWHILNKYPSGLKWNQIQQLYATQYGEMLMFPEHYVREKRKHWSYFIDIVNENKDNKEANIYKIADPTISDGRLVLIDMHSEKSTTTFINAMIVKYFNIKNTKQRKYFLLDIVPLRNATVFDNVWKYVLCFTQPQHASYFYKQYHSISDAKSGHAQTNNAMDGAPIRATVSKFNLMKLKKFLDEIIPQSLPFSLNPLPSSDSNHLLALNQQQYASPLPFEIPLSGNIQVPQQATKDDIYEYVELKKERVHDPMRGDLSNKSQHVISNESEKKKSTVISPQIIECLWGLLTHYIDGLTIEQVTHLYNRQSNANTASVRYDTLSMERIEEILMSCRGFWFDKHTFPNGEDRWCHVSLYDLQKKTVLLKPNEFILYEYLREYIENMNCGEIVECTHFRSNLLIHFKHEESAQKLLKRQDLECRSIPIEVDEFSPKYSYDRIVSPSARPIRYNPNFNNILTSELSKQASITPHKLFDVLKGEAHSSALHHRIQTPQQLTRLLMDAYSPYIHIRNKDHSANENAFESVEDILLSAYRRYPRRMPLSLQHQNVSLNVKNKNYYNDIAQFFSKHPNGISLSRFRIEFVRDFDYIPAVPSLIEFLKSADIYSFYMNDLLDLYLLPMERYNTNGTANGEYKYPANGCTLQGLPFQTTTDSLTQLINDNISNCHILRRGMDRFVIRYKSQQIAEQAINSFCQKEIKDEGIVLVNDLPHLCNHVLTWIDSNCLY